MRYLFILRLNQLRNNFRLLRKSGRLRLFIGIFVLLFVWVGLFAGFYRAFTFLQTFMGVGEILIDRLIYMLTFALFIMLVFSNTVISFQLHLKGAEAAYLQTLPLPGSAIFRFLLLEGAVLSTWATVFLIFPVALAYGLSHGLSLFACLSLLLFAMGISSLAALIGALIAALIPPLLTPGRARRSILAAVIIIALTFPFWRSLSPSLRPAPDRETRMVNRLLDHSRITLCPLLPGYWAAEGFIQAGRGRVSRSLGFLSVLAVNVLFAWQIVELTAQRYYFTNRSLYRSRGGRRRRRKKCLKCAKVPKVESCRFARQKSIRGREKLTGKAATLGTSPPEADQPLAENFRHFRHFFPPLPSPVRALLIKDVKVFFRDPAQWLQTVILFGLLAIYIINIKNMPRNVYQPFWKNLITFFNLGATALILATLTTRFIYPSFSLEGRTFWVLGLAPIPRRTIFRARFWSSVAGALLVTEALMLLSNHILEVPGPLTLVTCGTLILMAGVLVSLALGLGAVFPDFLQDNPARIASGFGGTLTLVLSLIYISIVVGALALAWHLRTSDPAGEQLLLFPATGGFVLVLSLAGIWLPCRFGIRALEKFEL